MVEECEVKEDLNIGFISLRDKNLLILEMDAKTRQFIIRSNNMEIAGQIIQSLVFEFLNISNLSSFADFPIEIENLKKLILKVEEMESVRQQLSVNIALNSSDIRALVVKAEDARMLGEW